MVAALLRSPMMPPGLADRILVWAYSETVAYTLESCEWYSSDSFCHLHSLASEFIRDQLHGFYKEFSEWFNLADYADVGEQLEPSEVALFLKAAGAPEDADFCTIDNYDCFSGLRAVIRHRLDQGSLEEIKRAAELFNWTIDFGLDCSGANAHAVLKVGSVEAVAPFLIARILNRLPDGTKQRDPAYQARMSSVEQRFLPLRRC